MNEPEEGALENSGNESGIEEKALSTNTFPLDTLPAVLKVYTVEAAHSLSVAPEMIVLPVLTTIGAAIGNSRSIQLKADYQESAAVYGAVVAETGAMKSPCLSIAVKPLQLLETEKRRTWTSDATVEVIGPLLHEHPHGLLIVKDELVSLVTSMNQYKKGKGSDRQFYLSAYSGSPLRVDRKGGGGTAAFHLDVGRPFLGIIGCIQPDVLPSLKAENDAEDGFVERLLFAWPKPLPVSWQEKSISATVKAAYLGLVERLMVNDWPGRPNPMPLPFSPEAQKSWRIWHDDHMEETESVPPQMRGFYSKLKGYCARLALIHALASDPEAETISEASLRAAMAQIEYFKGELRKVLACLCRYVGTQSMEVERARHAIVRGYQKHGNLTRREAQQLQNFPAPIFGQAWSSLTVPNLVPIPGGSFILNPVITSQSESCQ